MSKFIIAHDVGTGGNKAVLVTPDGSICGGDFEPYDVHYPKLGWAEQEPEDWWRAVSLTTRRLLEKTGVQPQDLLAMTFSTQLLGIVPMDPKGEALRSAIIWLDNRATRQASVVMHKFINSRVFAMFAGAPLGGKDGIPKLLWLKVEEPEIYNRMCCFLDVDGYLLYRSTGRMVMEWSGASAFGLDLNKKDWLRWVFRYIGIDPGKLPSLVRSVDQVGTLSLEAARDCGLLEGTPVIAGAGDAQSAAVGSGAVGEGEGHLYLGTSGWVGVTTKRTPTGKHGVVTIQSADPSKALLFAESETAGACLKWVRDELYRAEKANPEVSNVYALMDEKVETVPSGSGRLLFMPWLYGERAPVYDTYVRSAFINLSAEHTREHMTRAVYEGVSYNMRWILEIVEEEFHFPVPTLRVIGGGARGAPWMQILADVTHRRVETVAHPIDAGAVGVALVAAIGLGIYPNFDALKSVVKVEKVFEPRKETAGIYDSLFGVYKEVYSHMKGIYRKLNEGRGTGKGASPSNT